MAEEAATENRAVAAYLLDGNGGCTLLQFPTFEDLAGRPDRLLWIHLDYSNPQAEEWLSQQSRLDPLVIESLLSQDSRPRSSPFHDGLLLGLRGVNHNPGAAPEDMIAIRLWVEENCVISSSQRRLTTLEDIRRELLQGTGPSSVNGLLIQLVAGIIDRIAETLEELENDFDNLEDLVQDTENAALRSQLATLRRMAISLRRYLAPQRDALVHLQNEPIAWLKKRDKLHLRENANRLNRYLEELDSISDRAIVVQEELASRLAEQINRRIYALTLVATVFMPLSFLTGLLGINVGGIPGAENRFGFLTFSGIVLLIIICQLLYLKKKKWF
jgi:zinc transporter